MDGHAHIIPYLGWPAGCRSVAERMHWLRFYVVGHSQSVRRLRDRRIWLGSWVELARMLARLTIVHRLLGVHLHGDMVVQPAPGR